MNWRQLQGRAVALPRPAKRLITQGVDAVLLLVALAAALAFTGAAGEVSLALAGAGGVLVLAAGLPLLATQGFYRAVIRFVGSRLALAAAWSMTLLAGLLMLAGWAGAGLKPSAAVSVALVFWAFATLGLVGSRLLMRAAVNPQRRGLENVAIYGAGDAGVRLSAALLAGRSFTPMVFVDTNPRLVGRAINGIPVHHPDELARLVAPLRLERVLLALPSVSRRQRQAIINQLAPLAVHVQTVPDIGDLVSGKARVDELKEVEAVDLLGRDPVPPDHELMASCIRGRSVMVTGAGGSIGSELCRQIIRLAPQRLVLFEISEAALYRVEHELTELAVSEGVTVELVPLLGSVHHRDRVESVLRAFDVQTVYHAAAYKHVPMVEYNMVEGVHNNVIGTWHSAEAALDAGVEHFVLISTDKAVSPVNVMGATKRMAELVLQGLAQRGGRTRFSMVRFGNVLESSGSVVPLFREQIRRGGPVTVTHPEIIRYFMTIPEAAQLVLQASAMSTGGDVFVLEMGSPVRIDELARRMIHLMGLTVRDASNPAGDIAIEYTGLRPAEKLYEELLIGTNVTGTQHPMIMRAMEQSLPWGRVHAALQQMLAAARAFDCERMRALLLEHVDGYRPANGVDDRVWQATRKTIPRPAATVTPITRRASPL
ncbi:MAG: polysaccharide biosynthesis protein [Chromatiales bacterium]|nr:polysaccharide biosynthesis protein [Chromatiales bacterium]